MLRCATSELGPRGDSQLSTVSLIVNELQPSLFRGLERSDIDFVVSAAVRRKCQRGAILCTEGEVADQLFMLLSGRARYFTLSEDGRRVILRWILPGDIFGGMSLMHDPEAYLVNTESVRDSEFLAWSRMDIRRIALRHPRMLENALTMASDYLKWYITAHLALTSQSAPQRLARVLFNLTKDSGLPVEGGIGLDITNEELADAAHITRFSTSRLLGEWQRKGLLVKHRGKLVVTSPERLLGHVPQRHATAI